MSVGYGGSPDHSYADMTYNSQDSNSNLVYIDMTPTTAAQQLSLAPNDGYMDMTCGRRSPCFKGRWCSQTLNFLAVYFEHVSVRRKVVGKLLLSYDDMGKSTDLISCCCL